MMDSDSYQESVQYKQCFKRNITYCLIEDIATIDLPEFNPENPDYKMTHQRTLLEEAEYVISIVVRSGNLSAESNNLTFKLGELSNGIASGPTL